MSARESLARVIDAADDRWQHGIGSGGYDPDGPPLWLADAALAWLSEWLRGEEVREAVALAVHGKGWGSSKPPLRPDDCGSCADAIRDADAALGVLAGMLGSEG